MEILGCSFCSKVSKYTCPRCNAKYCSVDCYKSLEHLKCSEEFYKEQVVSEMAALNPNLKPQKEILDILKRSSEFGMKEKNLKINTEDENDADDLTWTERFGDIDWDTVDEDYLWSKLTKQEQEEFYSLLHNLEKRKELSTLWQPEWFQEFIQASEQRPKDEEQLQMLRKNAKTEKETDASLENKDRKNEISSASECFESLNSGNRI